MQVMELHTHCWYLCSVNKRLKSLFCKQHIFFSQQSLLLSTWHDQKRIYAQKTFCEVKQKKMITTTSWHKLKVWTKLQNYKKKTVFFSLIKHTNSLLMIYTSVYINMIHTSVYTNIQVSYQLLYSLDLCTFIMHHNSFFVIPSAAITIIILVICINVQCCHKYNHPPYKGET